MKPEDHRKLLNYLLGKTGDENMTTKEKLKEIIEEQPEDATHEEIVRELAFAGMVERGLKDSRQGRLISNEEMGKRIRLWQK
jgi:predicted transcriptional regulator